MKLNQGLLFIKLILIIIAQTRAKDFQHISKLKHHTQNKILFESENLTDNFFKNDAFLDVNEIPVRYDQSQLWRIYNISKSNENLSDQLEMLFGGDIWKANTEFMDVAFRKDQLKKAKMFLNDLNLTSVILNDNIQNMIDEERSSENVVLARATDNSIANLTWNRYHDLKVIYKFLRQVREANPDLCRLYSIGTTHEGRSLKVLRISNNPTKNKQVWIDGGIHAREWISPATVTYIINNFIDNWDKLPEHITSKTWYFMPVMNPDGYVFSRNSNRMWRKNRAVNANSKCFGVDLNRNFNIGWISKGSSNQPCSDIYRGASPMSELETKAVAAFLSKRKQKLASYLTFHSYGQMVVYPWAYKPATVPDHNVLHQVASAAVKNVKRATGSVYTPSVTYKILGVAGGGSDDWSRAQLNIKYVYTIELRDKGEYAFILPPNQIMGTGLEGLTIVKTISSFIK